MHQNPFWRFEKIRRRSDSATVARPYPEGRTAAARRPDPERPTDKPLKGISGGITSVVMKAAEPSHQEQAASRRGARSALDTHTGKSHAD
jgi:hypothetical protein